MIVFKLGGSLLKSGLIKIWVNFIVDHFKGKAVIVPGGGIFADHIRSAQKDYCLADNVAHDMALHSMAQMGIVITSLDETNLNFCNNKDAINDSLNANQIAVIGSFSFLKKTISPSEKNWNLTSDSIALMVAEEIRVQTLFIVKSSSHTFKNKNDPLNQTMVDDLVSLNILDNHFSSQFRASKTTVFIYFRDQFPNPSDLMRA